MTAEHFQAPDAPGFKLDRRVVSAFARFAGGFWQGSTRTGAWLLTLTLATCLILSTAATVALNQWNRWFFDSLEARDTEAITQAVFVFALIIAAMAAIGVGIVLARETLQVRWRAWLVHHLVDRWLGRQRFYHMNVSGKEPPNPEYRISDDTRWATEPLVDLGIGLLSAVVGAAAFISILWTVGGSITFDAGFGPLTIPAYMVWVALAYGAIASGMMLWVGAPLVGYVGRKNEAEGYFRFGMMRIRDNAESVALMNGAGYERAILGRFYGTVVARWMAMVWQHGHLTWITNSVGPMKPIIPLLFCAPKYLSGDLTLGQVTQLAAAFVEVQIAISWVVDNYNRVAEWYASAKRVMDIVDACDEVDTDAVDAGRQPTRSADVRLTDFEVTDGAGRPLLWGDELVAEPGDTVHVSGDSSTGKSTLVRVLTGLWPSARGSLAMPDRADVMVAPQKSYLPLGSLKGALFYPDPALPVPDAHLQAALERVGLGALASRLEEVARWDQVLSNGERQRLAIARVLVHRPRVIILDDALSALDEASQQTLQARLRSELPQATIISLGQRPAPAGSHDRQLVLQRHADGAALVPLAGPALATAT
jgi:vitamin B12/bleomycin/antimicrobial peptide transport system ATP-binding/permease protein